MKSIALFILFSFLKQGFVFSQKDSISEIITEVDKPYFMAQAGSILSSGSWYNQTMICNTELQYHDVRSMFSINPMFNLQNGNFAGIGAGYHLKFFKKNRLKLGTGYFGGKIQYLRGDYISQFTSRFNNITDVYNTKSHSIELIVVLGKNFRLNKHWYINGEVGIGELFYESTNIPKTEGAKAFKDYKNDLEPFFKLGVNYRIGKFCD